MSDEKYPDRRLEPTKEEMDRAGEECKKLSEWLRQNGDDKVEDKDLLVVATLLAKAVFVTPPLLLFPDILKVLAETTFYYGYKRGEEDYKLKQLIG